LKEQFFIVNRLAVTMYDPGSLGQIVSGYEYKKDALADANYNNEIFYRKTRVDCKLYKVYTIKYLKSKKLNPSDPTNWYKEKNNKGAVKFELLAL
tara:strand:- start:31 stop:315 length:285 start_codon:yes stop_codon:yes gene_type:complete